MQATILRSAQGVAVVRHDPAVRMEVEKASIDIAAANGLWIQGAKPVSELYGGQPASGSSHSASGQAKGFEPRFLTFHSWKRGPGKMFSENKHVLLQALADAPEAGVNAARLELAKFLMAHGFDADALGYLAMIARDNPLAEEDPLFVALRGIARLRLGQEKLAARDLRHSMFDGEPEMHPWRARLAARLGDWPAVSAELAKSLVVMRGLDASERIDLGLLQAEAAIRSGDKWGAEKMLARLGGEITAIGDRRLVARADYLSGRLARLKGENALAAERFKEAMNFRVRPISLYAEYERVKALLADDAISADEAIDTLERLGLAWRGDRFEFDVMDTLAALYRDGNDYRNALATWRHAVTLYPDAPRSRDIAREMNSVFERLFYEGEADKLPPIRALALYHEFRELTPVGWRGDAMIRKLADRLVGVDLLAQAAELLEHQVEFRLKGIEKASVSARLAAIYLLDGKPEEALEALEDKHWIQAGDYIGGERARLKAQALSELGRYEEALDTLGKDDSRDAELLRADIHWRAKDWIGTARALGIILGERWKDPAPLTPIERQQVMQLAVSLSLAGDTDSLLTLRRNYARKMASLPEADAFMVFTAPDAGGAGDYRDLTAMVAQVSQLEAFMAGYREKVRDGSLWTIN
jgi:tetratricopeptide (TPR) repeat protein